MPQFSFLAPAFYDPLAAPLSDPTGMFREAPAMRRALARQRRLAKWLRDQLRAKGVDAEGPHPAQEGWALSVPSDEGFVFVLIDPKGGGEAPFTVRVDFAGPAEPEAEDAAATVKAILGASPAVWWVEAA